jgi:hypothetical protein
MFFGFRANLFWDLINWLANQSVLDFGEVWDFEILGSKV